MFDTVSFFLLNDRMFLIAVSGQKYVSSLLVQNKHLTLSLLYHFIDVASVYAI